MLSLPLVFDWLRVCTSASFFQPFTVGSWLLQRSVSALVPPGRRFGGIAAAARNARSHAALLLLLLLLLLL
eukprot:COSAG06_NODE_56612_length_283_cov_2235.641304_1_plen_70_part_01